MTPRLYTPGLLAGLAAWNVGGPQTSAVPAAQPPPDGGLPRFVLPGDVQIPRFVLPQDRARFTSQNLAFRESDRAVFRTFHPLLRPDDRLRVIPVQPRR